MSFMFALRRFRLPPLATHHVAHVEQQEVGERPPVFVKIQSAPDRHKAVSVVNSRDHWPDVAQCASARSLLAHVLSHLSKRTRWDAGGPRSRFPHAALFELAP